MNHLTHCPFCFKPLRKFNDLGSCEDGTICKYIFRFQENKNNNFYHIPVKSFNKYYILHSTQNKIITATWVYQTNRIFQLPRLLISIEKFYPIEQDVIKTSKQIVKKLLLMKLFE